MTGWIALGVYVAGFALTARIAFAMSDGSDRGEDRFSSVVIGLIWPIAAVIFAAIAVLALPTAGVKTRRDRREDAETARWEMGKLATRTAELEAENERLRQQQAQGRLRQVQPDRPVGHVLALRLGPAHLGLGNRLTPAGGACPGPRVPDGVIRALRAPSALGAALDEMLLRPGVDQARRGVVLAGEFLQRHLPARV